MFYKLKKTPQTTFLRLPRNGIVAVRTVQTKDHVRVLHLCHIFSVWIGEDTWEDVYLVSAARRQLLKI